ncbi:hypothetical protein ABEF95_015143 [Exophiala dermatitidis]|nr:hypothetical protein HRR74_003995 [Exophiala dermatitidis]KAJ4529070.1 hypothetical protein HRR73_000090 [Exophiala dermatitidis]KAJ4538468.1 hypothetical protein HRR77_006952 [Exophiala dermatitidis]KAJ4582446.1 hypothetical protein HRR81_001172 [Exophiala dermatitidis]KAJ4613699.1 hypothetical protein HRR85_003993 [Exophiala dermatitidis]
MSTAVTAESLVPIVSRIWRNGLSNEARLKSSRIGVCVSGGPDSMALAYLLRRVPEIDPSLRIKPLAFIVNHNARAESRKEADFVSRYLEKLDIESLVLDIDWGNGVDPATLPDFEMQARQARYRLVATAALQRNIRDLFLGHHQDDQVETILMRLIRNPSTSFLGLQGMAEESAIPCCEDIRGAHEVEQYEPLPDWLFHIDGTVSNVSESKRGINFAKQVTVSRKGGLRMHRPLLQFPKSRLIQTCKDNGVIYQKDKTNDDPTLTLRNAVRDLRKDRHGSNNEQHLPRALQAHSILQLCEHARKSTSSLMARGTEVLRMIKVDIFDLRCGSMTMTVPKNFVAACETDLAAGANALARLTSAISYQSRDDVPTLVPKERVLEFLEACRSPRSRSLTIQKVLLEKPDNDTVNSEDNQVRWKLSRPPMRSSEVKSAEQRFRPKVDGFSGEETTGTSQMDLDTVGGVWSDWILWDHRYWMRVRVPDTASVPEVHVRPYRQSDAPYVFSALNKEDSIMLRKILAEAGPGKLRYTLPVLTYQNRLLLFPTLNVLVPDLSTRDPGTVSIQCPLLDWEICYKVLDQPFIVEQARAIRWRNAVVRRDGDT